jgi:long-subunit acyl-CoA synthetase (AMP-forming)
MSLSSILVRSLLKNPSLPLIGTKQNRQWSWASREDVYKAIVEARYQLVNLGVEKGDRVAFKGKNSVEWIAWNMATNSLGAVWVPMYHEQNADYCHYIIQDCQPKVFINDNMDINVDVIKHPLT